MSKVTSLVIRIYANDKAFIEALKTKLDDGDKTDDLIQEALGEHFGGGMPDEDFEVDGPFFSVEENGDGEK